jgi:hypothetical protein
MKNLITFILILSLFSCEKKEKTSIDNEYFLIGTLRDYMGREKYEEEIERVDEYYQSEKKLCLAIDSIFKKKYPDLVFSSSVHKISKKDEYRLYSKKLAKKIESFYNYKYSGRGIAKKFIDFDSMNLDSLMNNMGDFFEKNYDTIYVGNLKLKLFETEKQKLSFITGAYVRYGSQVDSLYRIKVFNSSSKVKVLEELLKDIGCTKVEYDIEQSIPMGHTVSFIPTSKLIGYFEKHEKLK